MLLNLNKDAEPKTPMIIWIISTVAGGLFFLVLIAALKDIVLVSQKDDFAPVSTIGLVENLGNTLFTKFVVPFEVSSILFISAMVGAILLAKRDKQTID
jgi:NADH-quinone oxidoreductase subunit J